MRTFEDVSALLGSVGERLGVSGWVTLTEEDLQAFGRLTGDEHWIHVDPVRAKAEGPFGSVIVHGFFSLALVTALSNECYAVTSAKRWVNYGLDRVRFLAPLFPGTPVRLELSLEAATPMRQGGKLTLGCSLVTQEGATVMAATWIALVIEDEGDAQ
jgi:acyl dehydratase